MLLSRNELKNLAKTFDQWHISIYMPTHRAGNQIQQGPIRLKNLLDEAEESLVEAGLSLPKAQTLLNPAQAYVEDEIFWQHQNEGLALFLADDFFRYYQLPFDFDELMVVGDHFHIKPLLPALSNNGRFYLLALDKEEIQLYQGSRYQLSEINLETVPEGLEEILKWEDPEKRLQLHTASKSLPGGGMAAIFHGHGFASEDDPNEYILRYFQRVDEGVREWLAGKEAPLVLAGVDYLLPLYREANGYPHLIEQGIKKDPKSSTLTTIHQQAWNIVEPIFREEQEETLSAFQHLKGTASDRVSQELEEIVRASYYERIEALFVALDTQHWGSFDPETNEVEFHQEAQPAGLDLLDFAAAHTLMNGGRVYVVNNKIIPNEESAAAIFRY